MYKSEPFTFMSQVSNELLWRKSSHYSDQASKQVSIYISEAFYNRFSNKDSGHEKLSLDFDVAIWSYVVCGNNNPPKRT